MYTKGELEAMDIPQLVGIADELGIKVTPDDQMEDVIYAILDKAAENSATDDAAPKRKRTRITKKTQAKSTPLRVKMARILIVKPIVGKK